MSSLGSQRSTTAPRELLIRQTTWEADDVLSLEFVDPAGGKLSAWTPGAHIDLVLPTGVVRQYSLLGDPDDPYRYRVAVLKETRGRGGSVHIHNHARAGTTMTVAGPRNHFALMPSGSYLFIAGGIGITPILPMVRHAQRQGAEWTLVYGGRSRSSMAFLEEAERLDSRRVVVVPQDTDGLPDLHATITSADRDTAVYCCGPEGLLRAVERECRATLRSDALHIERFGAPPAEAAKTAPTPVADERPFTVELRRSRITVEVPADRTLLEVVKEVAPGVLYSCEEGYCGSCEVDVLDGTPDHRDTILSDADKAGGRTMMICVGRSLTPRLVLDV
ncbi:PDR/VanB family oxidoreductase [Dactylosporangium sp. CA-233914]|uniref:PDR/VanB family oxidoreductase n=1 Tax=Dactylosporangium sp. CA-233914 TaxID=3239934 RepID=UPI003D8BC1D9